MGLMSEKWREVERLSGTATLQVADQRAERRSGPPGPGPVGVQRSKRRPPQSVQRRLQSKENR